MALTVRGDGTGAAYLVSASWWNDYYSLLTGSMHDQAVDLNYRPGSGTTGNTLTLKGDGFNFLLKGYQTDDATRAFSLDSSGNELLAGSLTFGVGPGAGISSGAAQQGFLYASATANATVLTAPLNGASAGGLLIATWDGAAKVNLFSFGGQFSSALAYVDNSGHFYDNTKPLYRVDGNGTTTGRTIYLGTSAPTSPQEGDVWIKG